MSEMAEHPAFRSLDPKELSPLENYRVLLHCVSPRPIAFTSTLSAEGKPNLAPFSYFMLGGANPPSVAISPTNTRAGSAKDTLHNIEETGEYVINVVSYAMRERMNLTSAAFPLGVSEWDEAGFTPIPSNVVKPNRVSESPLNIECKLFKVVHHGEGPLSANYVIGEVVMFHVREDLFDEAGVIHGERIDAIGRMGGEYYCRTCDESLFELPRPPAIGS